MAVLRPRQPAAIPGFGFIAGQRIYVHVLKQTEAVLLPKSAKEFGGGYVMQTGDKVELIKTDSGTLMRMPAPTKDPVDNIVVLQMC